MILEDSNSKDDIIEIIDIEETRTNKKKKKSKSV